MQFGGTADEANSRTMYDASRSAGINFFDTAHLYTGGVSEEFLGAFAGSERDDLYIATKAGYTGDSTASNISTTFDISRKRLAWTWSRHCTCTAGTTPPLEETFEALATLQADGKIRHIGVSNFAAWQVMKAQAVTQKMGTKIDIFQPRLKSYPWQRQRGLPLCPTPPLAVVF